MKYNIIVLSNQFFDSELKTNKWHVAKRFAQNGNKVIFVDPPVRFKALKKFLKSPSFNLSKLFANIDRKSDNLIVYSGSNLFNFWPFSSMNTWFHSRNIKKIGGTLFDSNFKNVLYIYHFDYPDLENFIKKGRPDVLVYDCVDEYTEFPEYAYRKRVNPSVISWIQRFDDELKIKLNQHGISGKDWVLYREEWLCNNCDLVFASAPHLVEKLEKWREHVEYLPNGGEAEAFDISKEEVEEPKDIKNIPHPRVGFVGAIDSYKNNISLIEKAATALPSFQFIMIGPEKVSDPDLDLSKLKQMNNVHFLGQRPWVSIPSYFAYFDVHFIPYNLNDYTLGCHPIKYFESLAAGLPTVVTDLPACRLFDIDGYVSKDDETFIQNIKIGVEQNTPDKIARRKKLAYENTWDAKVDKILGLIDNTIKR